MVRKLVSPAVIMPARLFVNANADIQVTLGKMLHGECMISSMRMKRGVLFWCRSRSRRIARFLAKHELGMMSTSRRCERGTM